MNKYTCHCCGYLILEQQIHDICLICNWQNDPSSLYNPDLEAPANSNISLRQAQKNFIEFGACDMYGLKNVRPPTNKDKKDPDWKQIIN
jgi:hypothetical protein